MGQARSIVGPVRLSSDTLATPVGDIHLVCDDRALCALDFGDFADRLHRLLRRRYGSYELIRGRDGLGVRTRLERYFEGDLGAVDAIAVDPGGTPYQQSVWRHLRAIPFGQTRSYGDLAAAIGATHARAVGAANALNPIAIVVPCHRVIGADSALTGYAGGIARKRWLLDHESRQISLALPSIEPQRY